MITDLDKDTAQGFWSKLSQDQKYNLMKLASGLPNPSAVKEFKIVPEMVISYLAESSLRYDKSNYN